MHLLTSWLLLLPLFFLVLQKFLVAGIHFKMPHKTITRAEVAKNNTDESLWFVIDSKVYDVTDFLDAHRTSYPTPIFPNSLSRTRQRTSEAGWFIFCTPTATFSSESFPGSLDI